MNSPHNADVAHTILAQLGDNRFLAMTGARGLLSSPSSLTFKLPRGGRSPEGRPVNWVRITLDAADTYTCEFGRASGLSLVIDCTRELVDASQLRELFTLRTGLRVSL